MKHDESLALAALLDCWQPKWRKVSPPVGFHADVAPALRAFGFDPVPGGPFGLSRLPANKDGTDLSLPTHEDHATLCTWQQIRSPGVLRLFRRSYPRCVILCAKSGLFWVVWDKSTPTRPTFYISTAEYIPTRA